jgi:hypothetical protein
MRWYAVLFWIWVVASLGIFVWRRVNGSNDENDAMDAEEPSLALTKQWAPPPLDPDLASSSDPPDPAAMTTPGPTAAAEPSPTDGPNTGAVPPTPPPVRGATLAELLSGITLPLGLVPLTQSAPTSGPSTSIVVATDAAGAEQVDAALTEAISSLGYTVRSTGPHTSVAEGPRGAVEIELHPRAATAAEGGTLLFPTAGSDSVVVELRVAGAPGSRA